ncbi:hypothetical protein [Streptomyces sp. AD681]|uniref:hypothetical protein n=1 Tax=Streptomyces sp. AD681 TaxID=3019069 RepID=UPI002FDD5DAD
MAEQKSARTLPRPLHAAASAVRKVPGAGTVGKAAEGALDRIGAVSPRGRRVLVYTGAGVLGVAGLVEWPVAVTGAAVAWLTQQRGQDRNGNAGKTTARAGAGQTGTAGTAKAAGSAGTAAAKRAGGAKKTAAKSTAAKSTAAKKSSAAKKSAANKTAANKTTAKKTTEKKSAAKKTASPTRAKSQSGTKASSSRPSTSRGSRTRKTAAASRTRTSG